jgi:hypothetical protein
MAFLVRIVRIAMLSVSRVFRASAAVGVVLAGVAPLLVGAALAGPVGLAESGPAAAEARRIMAAQIAAYDKAPTPEKARVSAGYADVGDAGGPALVVRVEHAITCGAAGCLTVLYRRVGANWVKALEVSASAVGVAAGGGRTPADVVVDGHPWRFDGKVYRVSR